MQSFRLSTNINCNGCIARVTPFFTAEPRILDWKVDIADPSKPLTIASEGMRPEELMDLLARAGFKGKWLEEK